MLTRQPIIQIHATRFCNYACLHCYSSSSPQDRAHLSKSSLLATTERLSNAGYRRAALSGGEPVLYPDFQPLAQGLSEQGLKVSLISNGSRPAPLLQAMKGGCVDHCSISIDGPEALHDQIRQSKGAFERAVKTIRTLIEQDLSCGIVLAVSRGSLPHIPDLITYFASLGVTQVQLHPLAQTGRAAKNASVLGQELPQEALLRLILLARVLEAQFPKIKVHCDAVLRRGLTALPLPKADQLISPLVIRDDGSVAPYAYDMQRSFDLGHIRSPFFSPHVTPELAQMIQHSLDLSSKDVATTFYRDLVASSHVLGSIAPGVG